MECVLEWRLGTLNKTPINLIIGYLKYCEATIDHSQLSYQEKEDHKRQMKQSLEVYIQGVKDKMRAKERMR